MALPNPNAAPAVPSAPQAPASTKPSAPGAAAAGKDPSQPKKVRTLAIRPDNPDEVARPQLTAPASPPGQTATPPATTRTPASTKPASQSRNGSAQGEQPGASRLASLPAAAAARGNDPPADSRDLVSVLVGGRWLSVRVPGLEDALLSLLGAKPADGALVPAGSAGAPLPDGIQFTGGRQ